MLLLIFTGTKCLTGLYLNGSHDLKLWKKNANSETLDAFLHTDQCSWDKVFKSGQCKFCGRQSSKKFKGYGLLQTISLEIFLKAVFYKIYLILSWILCPSFTSVLSLHCYFNHVCSSSRLTKLLLMTPRKCYCKSWIRLC